MGGNKVALRVDDIGAASKMNEVYGASRLPLGPIALPFPGNFLFFKYIKPFKKWGPYPELTTEKLEVIFEYCQTHQLRLTLGVTAGWVERDGSVTPFPEKYPKQALAIKSAARNGLVEVANHGYTHCVLKDKAFRPRLFGSNRQWHREFWEWVPLEIQERQLALSQKILQGYFSAPVVTFIPPGNVFINETLVIAKRHGLRYLSCQGIDAKNIKDLIPIPESNVIAFHDKELVADGVKWFEKIQSNIRSRSVALICEIGRELETSGVRL